MSDVIDNSPSMGTKIAHGRSLVANNGTIVTGIRSNRFVGNSLSSDTVVAATTITGGTVTISLKTAGANATGNHYVDWEAWDSNKT